MAAKKTQNKSAFVRSLPSTMPIKDVVAKAKAAGLTLTEKYVSTIRYNAKVSARKKSGGGAKRGPGRPPKSAAVHAAPAMPRAPSGGGGGASGGLVAEVERIVERKVGEILRQRLGALFGR